LDVDVDGPVGVPSKGSVEVETGTEGVCVGVEIMGFGAATEVGVEGGDLWV